MPYYELLCLASGRLGRKDLSSVLHKACRIFMDNGGTVTRLVPLGANGNGPRKLAYRIRQNQVSHHTGFYINICAFASTDTVNEVSRQLKIDERVLRHSFYKRSLMDCVRRIPDVDDVPDIEQNIDPGDADYELQKFMGEFQRDFPDGFSADEVPKQAQGESGLHNDMLGMSNEESKMNSSNVGNKTVSEEESVRDILAQLKGASTTKSSNNDGLAWLSKLKKPGDSTNDDSK